MRRVAFRLQIRVELLEDYIEFHKNVWPEMLAELSKAGWHNYSLHVDKNDGVLFGYFETPDPSLARLQMGLSEVNRSWQRIMAPFFLQLDGLRPDESQTPLEEIFFLA